MEIALEIAKYIIGKCTRDGHPISNLQLQKILYYIQRFFLISTHHPLFEDEIEAWQFGPVCPDVYYHFCGFGSMPISVEYDVTLNLSDEQIKEIDNLSDENREKNPWDLVKETHREGGAWDTVYLNGAGNHRVIPNELIETRG